MGLGQKYEGAEKSEKTHLSAIMKDMAKGSQKIFDFIVKLQKHFGHTAPGEPKSVKVNQTSPSWSRCQAVLRKYLDMNALQNNRWSNQ